MTERSCGLLTDKDDDAACQYSRESPRFLSRFPDRKRVAFSVLTRPEVQDVITIELLEIGFARDPCERSELLR